MIKKTGDAKLKALESEPRGASEAEPFTLAANSWFTGLRYSFFSTTRCAPPSMSQLREGSLRTFVVPVDGEPGERRVVITSDQTGRAVEPAPSAPAPPMARRQRSNSDPTADRTPAPHAVLLAAAQAPPIGEWPSSAAALAD